MEINKEYFDKNNLRILSQLYENSEFQSAILQNFFTEKFFNEISNEIRSLQFKENRELLRRFYFESEIPDKLNKVLNSSEFIELISQIISKLVKTISGEILHLTWKNYEILHDEKTEKGIELIFDFTENWDENYGGKIVYVDGEGNYTSLPIQKNTLSIINSNSQRFIQYVNHRARNKNRFILVGRIH